MTSQELCVFCNIEPKRIINEGKLFISFLSNPRLKKGHSLVAPKRHVELPTDLAEDEDLAILHEIRRLQTTIIRNTALGGGCDQWQKYQPFVPDGGNRGTKIDHTHFHVIPRGENDRLFMTPEPNQLDEFTVLSDHERQEMLELLKEKNG